MSGKPKIADMPSDQTTGDAADPAAAAESELAQRDPGNDELTATDTAGDDAVVAEPSPADLKAQAAENWDKYVRALAELDNVRKRAQRDIDNARKFALDRFAAELLAVRDSFELGLAAGEQGDAAAIRAGFEATLKLLATTMEQFGVREIDPLGEPFDPQLHEAISLQPSDTMEPGSVLTVFQKGYTLNGRLLRPARVVVSAEPARPA